MLTMKTLPRLVAAQGDPSLHLTHCTVAQMSFIFMIVLQKFLDFQPGNLCKLKAAVKLHCGFLLSPKGKWY